MLSKNIGKKFLHINTDLSNLTVLMSTYPNYNLALLDKDLIGIKKHTSISGICLSSQIISIIKRHVKCRP
jgi:hypothetical protein